MTQHSIPKTQQYMMVGTVLAALVSLIDAPYLGAAPLQTGPTLVMLAALFFGLRKYPIPNAAIACFCAFLVFHTIGARYIYSYVPYDAWFAAIGLPQPTELFDWQRNHYDRLVHFSFGALFAFPIYAALTVHRGVKPLSALYIAAEFIIAASALYEVFEWLLTLTLASADADAYNGQQGDMWDAQKDMALASLGAVIACLAIYFKSRRTTEVS